MAIGTHATIGIMTGALAVSAVGWLLTRGGADDAMRVDVRPGLLGGDDEHERAVRMTEQLVDEICACDDLACAEHVMERLPAVWQANTRLTDVQQAQMSKLVQRITECETRLMNAATPPAPMISGR